MTEIEIGPLLAHSIFYTAVTVTLIIISAYVGISLLMARLMSDE